MTESFSKVIAIIIATIILVLIPMINLFENQDRITQMHLMNETTYFVDSVRTQGFLSPEKYYQYMHKLDASNNIYSVKFYHYHVSYDPVYESSSGEKIFTGKYITNLKLVTQEDIIQTINNQQKYTFDSGDFFYVKLFNKNKTLATQLEEYILGRRLDVMKIYVSYGGMVKNEIN